jgi:catechol 2,3-dioxygenase-like lactoylglutathione lyase family enzyme
MLGAHSIYPVLLATDLAVTREFYHDRLGLEILNENEDALTFGCGAGTQFSVTKSTVGTADSQTQVSWDVSDIRAEVRAPITRGQGRRLRPAWPQDRGWNCRHRVRVGSLDHRSGQERSWHPPAQGLTYSTTPSARRGRATSRPMQHPYGDPIAACS